MTAACAGHKEPLWDATIAGENEIERVERQARGLAICRRCPDRIECAATVDVKHDDGIRGGMVLPTIRDKDRRNAATFVPGRGGLAVLICGDNTPRHSREFVPPTWENVFTTKDGPGCRAANSDRALPPRDRRFHMSTPLPCDSPRGAVR